MRAIKDQWNNTCISQNNDFMCALCQLNDTEKHDPYPYKKPLSILSTCVAFPGRKPQTVLDGGDCEYFDGKGLGQGSGRGILEKLQDKIFELSA